MKTTLILALLAISTYCLTPYELEGYYDVGDQCQNICPRVYFGNWFFNCPVPGKEKANIFRSSPGRYSINLTNKSASGIQEVFTASFNENNIIPVPGFNRDQLKIWLKDGYALNMMKCYHEMPEKKNPEPCVNLLPSKFYPGEYYGVWKTDSDGKVCEGCAFGMVKTPLGGDFLKK